MGCANYPLIFDEARVFTLTIPIQGEHVGAQWEIAHRERLMLDTLA